MNIEKDKGVDRFKWLRENSNAEHDNEFQIP